MSELADTVAPRPCASCPYRRDVPAGIWDTSEYAKLPDYDGEIHEQAIAGANAAFACHRDDGRLCAGWLGHRDPFELLAVRLGLAAGSMPAQVLDYRTDVPLFASGAEAAAHGLSTVRNPDPAAVAAAVKILAARRARRG